MAVNIDERVVEMRFDNKQFEQGVKQSMKTLKNLDDTIDHIDKSASLDEMSKKLNSLRFDKLEDNVESLTKRFSAFGVAGMTVIQDLTHAAENLFYTFGSWLRKPLAIAKSGGWARALNIEDAKFQLKGLGVAWNDVKDDIDYAVSGTAFGLDAAAKAASQLVASGVELGNSMKGALRGISGVAAMTNSTYEEISPIFTTVAGQGRLMTMQLRQLEARGLNAAAAIAKSLGTSEAALREMVTKGKIDFNTFAKAMDDAFGEHAKDANTTFTGALGNMQFALKKIGAVIAEEVQHDFTGVFNEWRLVINELAKELGPTLEYINKWVKVAAQALELAAKWVVESGKLKEIVKTVDGVMRSFGEFFGKAVVISQKLLPPLKQAFYDLGVALGIISEKTEEVTDGLSPLDDGLNTILKGLVYGLTILTNVINKITDFVKYLKNNEFISKLIDTVIPFIKRYFPIILAFFVLSKFHLGGLSKILYAVAIAIGVLTGTELPGFLGDAARAIKTFALIVLSAFKPAVDAIYKGLQYLWGIFEPVGNALKEFIKNLDLMQMAFMELALGIATAVVIISMAFYKLSVSLASFNPFLWLTKLANGFRNLLTGLGTSAAFVTFAGAIIALGVSMGLMADAVIKLGTAIEGHEKAFTIAITALTIFTIIGTVAVSILKYLSNNLKMLIAQSSNVVRFSNAVTLLSNAVKSFGKAAELRSLGSVILSIAVLIGTLALAIGILATSVDPTKMAIATMAVASILLTVGILIAALRNVQGNIAGSDIMNVFALTTAMIALSVGLSIFADALAKLSKIELSPTFIDTLIATLAIMAGSIGIIFALSLRFGNELQMVSQSIRDIGIGMLALAVILWMLPNVIDSVGNAVKNIGDGLHELTDYAVGVLMEYLAQSPVFLALAAGIIILVSEFAKNAINVFTILMSFVSTFSMFLNTMVSIGKDEESIKALERSFDVIIKFMTGFAIMCGAIIYSSQFAKHGIAAALLLTAVAFVLSSTFSTISTAYEWGVKAFSTGDINSVLSGIAGLTLVIAAIVGVLALASNKYFRKGARTMLAVAATVGVLSASIAILTSIAKDNPMELLLVTLGVVTVFTIIIDELTALYKNTSASVFNADIFRAIAKTIAQLSMVVLSLTASIAILTKLSAAHPTEVITSSISILTLFMSLIAITDHLSKSAQTIDLSSLTGMERMAAVIKKIAGIVIALSIAIGTLAVVAKGHPEDLVWSAITIFGLLIGLLQVINNFKTRSNSFSVEFRTYGNLIKVILALSGSMVALTACIAILTPIIKDDPIPTLMSAGSILLSLIGVAKLIESFSKNVKILDVLKSAAGIALVSASIATAIGVMTGLLHNAGVDSTEVINNTTALTMGLASTAVAFGVLAKAMDGVDWDDVGKAILGMAGISASLDIIAAAMGIVARVPYEEAEKSMRALAEMFGLIALVFAGLSRVIEGKGAMTLLAIAAAFVAVSASLPIVAAGLSAIFNSLKDMDPAIIEHVMDSTYTFIEVMAVLVSVITVAAGIVAGKIPEVALGLLAVGGLFILLGAAAWLACEGFAKVIDAFANAAEKFGTVTVYMGIHSKDVDKAAKSLSAGLGTMGKGIRVFLANVGKGIGEFISGPVDAICSIPGKIIFAIGKGLADLISIIGTAGTGLVSEVSIIVSSIGDTLYNGLIMTAQMLRYGLQDMGTIIFGSAEEVGAWVPRSMAQGMAKNAENAIGAAQKVGATIEEAIRNTLQVHSLSPLFFAIGKWVSDSLGLGLISEEDQIEYEAKDVFQVIGDCFNEEASAKADEGVQALVDGIGNSLTGGGFDLLKGLGIESGESYVQGLIDEISAGTAGIGSIFGPSGRDVYKIAKQKLEGDTSLMAKVKYEAMYVDKEWKPGGERTLEMTSAYGRALSATVKDVSENWTMADTILNNFGDGLDKINEQTSDLTNGLGGLTDGMDGLTDSEQKTTTQTKETTDFLKELTETVKNSTNTFEKFDDTITMTKEDLFESVESQTQKIKDWEKGIEVLAQRGFSKRLVKQLIEQGPDQSYQIVSSLLTMTKEEMEKFNSEYAERLKLPKKTKKKLGKLYDKDGHYIGDKLTKGMEEAWKEYSYGTVPQSLEQLTESFKENFKHIKMKDIIAASGIDHFQKSLDRYVELSTKTTKKARKEYKEYILEAYMATLSEAELEEAVKKSKEDPEELAKEVGKWWGEQAEAVKDSVHSQMRSMKDLRDEYGITGEELKAQYTQQNKDFREDFANRNYLAMILETMPKPQKVFAAYLRTEASTEEVFAVLDGYTTAMAEGGTEAAEAYLLSMSRAWKGSSIQNYISEYVTEYEAAAKSGNKELMKALTDDLQQYVTKLPTTAEKFETVVNGIKDGLGELMHSDMQFGRMTKNITKAFRGMTSVLNTGGLEIGEYAIRQYALSLLDMEEIMEEAKVFGVDTEEVISAHLEEITNTVLDFRDSIASSLESAIVTFEKFDEGEEITFQTLEENLRNNITKLNEWRANIRKLQAKGYSQQVIEAMTSEGIGSYAKVAALVSEDATNIGVDAINQMYGQLKENAETGADEAVGAVMISASTVGTDTMDKVEEVIDDKFQNMKPEITDVVSDSLGGAISDGLENAKIPETCEEAANLAATTLANTIDNHENRLKVRDAAQHLGERIGTGIRKAIKADRADDSESGTKAKIESYGRFLMNGLVHGINDNKQKVIDAVKSVCQEAIETAREEFDINSPSRVTQWMGYMIDMGFAKGIDENTYYVEDSVENLTKQMIEYMAKVHDEIDDYVNDDDYVIKPVLDLDNLQNARSLIAKEFAGDNTIALRSTQLAGQTTSNSQFMQLMDMLNGYKGNTSTVNYGDTTIVVNAPEGTDENQIAEMVMEKMQQRVDRRKYV